MVGSPRFRPWSSSRTSPVHYWTVADKSVYHLDPIKGSRFIASIFPVQTEEAAMAALNEVRGDFSDARHHCWAFLLREDERSRSSDDGEPGGSAGRPILAQLVGHELSDLMVVVTRYFGGTKLGVGGLIRAYGGCAGKGLDQAERVEVVETQDLLLSYDYDLTSAVDAVLGSESLEKHNPAYGAAVQVTLRIPLEDVTRISQLLNDRTRGRINIG